MKQIKLFCIPYAGGSAQIFKSWNQHLDSNIELVPIELAGRGKRIQENLCDSIEKTVDNIIHVIKDDILKSDYAFFGHSMGALLSYELALKIRQLDMRQPQYLFFSGRGAPNVVDKKDRQYHLLNEEDFRNKVLDLGGTPPEFFEHPALMELFIPVLRNDFKLSSVSFDQREIWPFDCDISVLLGKEEEVTPEQASDWKKHTIANCSIHYFNGGHFFFHDHVEGITKIINQALQPKIDHEKFRNKSIINDDARKSFSF